MAAEKHRGKCEGCDRSPRVLAQIESGQWVCQTCLREIRGPRRPQHLAPLDKIEELRNKGLQVPDDLTKKEYRQYENQLNRRKVYTEAELDQIYRHYAELKGWSTYDKVVKEKIAEWNGDGPVQLAIEFHETGVDGAYYLGYDPGSRTAEGSDRILQFATVVAGIEYSNQDGTSRAQIIDRCQAYEELTLGHEPDNPHDPNAIMVCRKNREQLGYVPRKVAAEVMDRAKRGFGHCAFFREKAQRYGQTEARFILVISQPGVSREEVAAFCQRWIRPREPTQ